MPVYLCQQSWNVRFGGAGLVLILDKDGKGRQAQRPVLIVKKFNHQICWAVPLTTQIKDNQHYHYFEFLNKPQCALLTQMKLIDVSRLNKKMGRLGKEEFKKIRDKLILYLS